jgi:hypothetical protein
MHTPESLAHTISATRHASEPGPHALAAAESIGILLIGDTPAVTFAGQPAGASSTRRCPGEPSGRMPFAVTWIALVGDGACDTRVG